MNYLAHIFLSGDDRRVQIGNFVGDAVKGRAYENYPLGFREGILLHREIDDYTDHHPVVREVVDMLRGGFGRYSGVLTDIYFDHLLARSFQSYSGQSLRWFAFGFYRALVLNYRHLPERFKGFLWHFILTNRLVRYASLSGIKRSWKSWWNTRIWELTRGRPSSFSRGIRIGYRSCSIVSCRMFKRNVV